MSVVDKIKHYQRSIEKCDENGDRMLHCISKLSNLPVTVQHLQETGVGRTVNALRKYENGVGDAAKALVAKWKAMVASEETSEGEDEDEACVPDAPESYSDGRDTPQSEENFGREKTKETEKHIHKAEKIEALNTSHKHSSKQESKQKSDKTQAKRTSDVVKNTSSESEKQKKYDKDKHNHKHQSRNEKDSLKDSKSASKKDEIHGSKHHSQTKSENTEKCSNKSTDNSSLHKSTEENYKKRKSDSSSNTRKENKRRKTSESENDEVKIHTSTSEKHNSYCASTTIKIKEEPKNRDGTSKNEIKHEKKDSQEKLKATSSKHKNDSTSSKLKDNGEKSKYKNDNQTSHNKDESKKVNSHHSNKDLAESKHRNSSSSDKHCDKSKDKSKKKDHKEEKSNSKNNKDSKHVKLGSKESKELVKIKQEINGDEGIDCNSGASFAEALGMCTITQPSRKRINNSASTSSTKTVKVDPPASPPKKPVLKTEPINTDPLQPPSLLSSNVKLEPLSVDLASTLPEISPNYKPLPYINPVLRKEEDKLLTDVICVKNQRTKVYSGNKSGYLTVPSLFEMCIQVLIENIDALEFTGGVPFDIIKPVLERATPDQLFMVEHYNPYLIDDTDRLWEFHCNRQFRNKQREEMETWREMYMRCLDEREAKLKTLTANIKQSIDKSVPVRSTKLAYVDNVVKPPRNVLKKQAKYGTANSVPSTTSSLKNKLISGGGPTSATNISVPPPPVSRAKTSSGSMKKTKAPLMAKALQLIKGRYKR